MATAIQRAMDYFDQPEQGYRFSALTVAFITLLVSTLSGVYITWTTRYYNHIDLPYITMLLLFTIGIPYFVTYGVYMIYRHIYISEGDQKSIQQRVTHVAMQHYMLEMSALINTMTVIATVLVWRDSAASHYWAEQLNATGNNIAPTYLQGRGALPLYLTSGSQYQVYFLPTAIFWMAYLGAVMSILNMIFHRFTIRHLVPRTYFNATLRFIAAIVASALIFLAFIAFDQFSLVNITTVGSQVVGETANVIDEDTLVPTTNSVQFTLKNGAFLLLLAFFAGMFPEATNRWIMELLQQVTKRFIQQHHDPKLTEIIGIEEDMMIFLQQEGIWTLVDLARRDAEKLAIRLHLDKDVIEDWQRQARLLLELGTSELIEQFRKLAINDFDDLAALDIDVATLTMSDFVTTGTEEISPVVVKVLKHKYQQKNALAAPVTNSETATLATAESSTEAQSA